MIRFTPREIDILNTLLDGESNKQIGNTLGISKTTIDTCIARLRQKISVSNKVKLAIWYYYNKNRIMKAKGGGYYVTSR